MSKEELKDGQHWGVDSDVFIGDDELDDFDRISDMVNASDFDPTKAPDADKTIKSS
jgi:hypothetical protein